MNAPRTMTHIGLKFLQSLASENKSGCFLEVGPLFGSSTNAIDAGRNIDETIHTIDTFEAAPWVHKRFGFDLSRELFDKFTSNVDNLIVHEGYAPDVVEKSWSDKIGFYFDDATHGDPGWSNNYNFFKEFFQEDTIICGDDFAGGWPDIVRNVYQIVQENDLRLFVIGRVWAFAYKDDHRIENAVRATCPKLKDFDILATHSSKESRNLAASWSWGVHLTEPLDKFQIIGTSSFKGKIKLFKGNESKGSIDLGSNVVELADVDQLHFSLPKGISLQFCLANDATGKTENTQGFKDGTKYVIPKGFRITAVRLSEF